MRCDAMLGLEAYMSHRDVVLSHRTIIRPTLSRQTSLHRSSIVLLTSRYRPGYRHRVNDVIERYGENDPNQIP